MTTPPPPPTGRGITMLGASEAGKTSFLAALQIALLRQPDLGWSLTGDDQGSTVAMIDFMDAMSNRHAFPKPTEFRHENYRWSLVGEIHGVKDHWYSFRGHTERIRIPLNLVDGPGEAARGRNLQADMSESQDLLKSLAGSAGITLFFDPVLEAEQGHAFQHLYGVLTLLRSQAAPHGKLPHYVAFCINKFDAVTIFRSAQALRILQYDAETGAPFVPGEYAQEFFERLITRSRSDDASMILPLLRATFHEDRIRFFVTSAIGFYIDPTIREFDPADYQNHIPGKPGRIRGGVYPINVIEPVLWLGRIVGKMAGS